MGVPGLFQHARTVGKKVVLAETSEMNVFVDGSSVFYNEFRRRLPYNTIWKHIIEIFGSSIHWAPNDTNFLNRQSLLNLLSNCQN